MNRKPRILVLDDDPLYLRVWEKIFRGMPDINVCLTNDPKIIEAAINAEPVDLVISDIVMNGGSGYDVARFVDLNQPTTQIVLTTGYDCNLSNFDLRDPKFHLLYKPYKNVLNIQRFVIQLLQRADVYSKNPEDSYSENDEYPNVTEWRL